MRYLTTTGRGVLIAVRTHPWAAATALAVTLVIQVLLPPAILSLVRTPWTYFTFNPWLKRLPEYLVSNASLGAKLEFLSRVAVFWFSADGPYGAPEWGFAADGTDLLRFLLTACLVGLWLALWRAQRAALFATRGRVSGSRGSAAGVLAGVLGLTTAPCSVAGCGAPVLPVVGLAFTGLSSGTVLLLSTLSSVIATVLLIVLAAGVAYLGWRVGAAAPRTHAPS